jgi:hypothetical protein
MATSFLCVRCEAGLLLPFNMEQYIDARTNHRSQHIGVELPMRHHAIDNEQQLLICTSAATGKLKFNAEVLCE